MTGRIASRCRFLGILLVIAIVLVPAISGQAISSAPKVESVDPPNWWVGLPNPMLLLHGKNLTGTKITSSTPNVVVEKSETSANGDWAFVWLNTLKEQPGHFDLLVQNKDGEQLVPYKLAPRHVSTAGFQGFSSRDVMYLIMPDRFADGDPSNDNLPQMPNTLDRSNDRAYHGGDLRGIEQHLDYIQKLGVNTIWLTPIVANDSESPQNYHGYAAVNLYQVNPHFGTLQDFTHLVNEIHQRQMKLVVDMVPNHVGPKHPWVLDSPAPDWFHGTADNHLRAKGKFASITDPHAPPSSYRVDLEGWFADRLPDLNQSNPKVKQYLIQNAIWWIETGAVDGIRLDTFPFVDREFWSDFHSTLHSLYPHLTSVGEIFNSDPTIVSYFAGGAKRAGIDTGLDTPFDFPIYFALRATLAGKAPMTQLAEVERQDWLYPHPERLVPFLGNHDTGRFLAEEGATPARMKLAFGLLATMRGMPEIYYGDEIAMSGNKDSNRKDFPGGFLGDKQNAFTKNGRTPEQESMHSWVEGVLNLRAQHEALKAGAQQNLFVDDTGFVFTRYTTAENKNIANSGEMLLVLLNKSDKARTFRLDFEGTAMDGIRKLSPFWNSSDEPTVKENGCNVSVAPESIIVLQAAR